MTKHPIPSVAALKRTLTPGTRIRIVNHIRPAANRETVVLDKTNTVDLVTEGINARTGETVPTHLSWPKKAEYRPDETDPSTVHIDSQPVDPYGKPTGAPATPFLTVTLLDVA